MEAVSKSTTGDNPYNVDTSLGSHAKASLLLLSWKQGAIVKATSQIGERKQGD